MAIKNVGYNPRTVLAMPCYYSEEAYPNIFIMALKAYDDRVSLSDTE